MATLEQRRRQFALRGTTGLLLVALILVLVNVLSNWTFLRVDLTQSRAYSLSPSSKRLVKQLEDPVIIKAYFTPDLPPPYNGFERYVRDMLTEYRTASGGRVKFEFIPPHPAKNFEQFAGEAGMAPIQFEQMGSDNLAIRRGFMGLTIFYRDKRESLPVIQNIQTLEFDLTSRIARMAQTTKKTLIMSSGHGETEWRAMRSKLSEDLSQLYDIQQLPLVGGATIPANADALVVYGAKQKFDEKALWTIDQAIMRGVPVGILYDDKNFMADQFLVMPQPTGLREFLDHYGIKLGTQLVYDAQCETVQVSQNLGGMMFTTNIRYPFIPLMTNLNTQHPILQGIQAVGLPFVVPVEKKPGSELQVTPLLSTSEKSWLAPEQTFRVAPNAIPNPKGDDPHGPYPVAVVAEGVYTSFFKDKPLPVPGATLIGTSPKTTVVVIGSSGALYPSMQMFQGAEPFLANLLAFLTKDDVLLGIRSKGQVLRPLKNSTDKTRPVIKLIAILGAPLLAVGLGLWRWRRRQAWRERISHVFLPNA